MDITFITDFVCPYCLVAKEALLKAAELAEIPITIRLQPRELTPEPTPRVDTFHDEKRRAGYLSLVEPAKALGLDMKLPPRVIPRPYSRLAFEGWFYAQDHGAGDAYSDKVYRAYFIHEQDIGQIDVLTALAEGCGLDAADFRHALEAGTYTRQEKQALAYTLEVLKPRELPTLWIDGREVVPAKYTVAEMLQILNDSNFQTFGGFHCGPEGC